MVQHGSFDPQLRELLLLTNAVANECRYCTAIHSTFATKAGIAPETVECVREGGLPENGRQAAAVRFARQVPHQRGAVSKQHLDEFLAAGFQKAQALEIICILALSLMANYSGHLTGAPPDEGIRAQYR